MTRRQTLTIEHPRWSEFVAQLKPMKRNASFRTYLKYLCEIIEALELMGGVDVRRSTEYICEVCGGDPVGWTKTNGSAVADRAAHLDA
jgi:hypothetical protein